MSKTRILPLLHSLYVLATAVWPLVHLQGFLKVTGPKTDIWLVNTVSLLLLCLGACLLVSAVQKNISTPLALLVLTICAALCYVDFYYAISGTISPVYLADGILQAVFAAGWIWAFRTSIPIK